MGVRGLRCRSKTPARVSFSLHYTFYRTRILVQILSNQPIRKLYKRPLRCPHLLYRHRRNPRPNRRGDGSFNRRECGFADCVRHVQSGGPWHDNHRCQVNGKAGWKEREFCGGLVFCYRHSPGAYLASKVAALATVKPLGTVAPLAKQRHATAPCSGAA